MNFELFLASYYEKILPHINSQESPTEQGTDHPEAALTPDTPTTDHAHDEHVEHDHDHDEHHHDDEDAHHDDEDGDIEHVTASDTNVSQPKTEQLENKYDEATQLIIDESDKARKEFDEVDSNFRSIEMEISEAKKKLELDVGPHNEFASMIDKCFEYEDREYIYKMCPYEKTVQKSKNNNAETSIGTWKGWNDDATKKYNLMHFDNGLSCWNGPQRSTKVHVSCGIENKITSVSEPNRCEVTKNETFTGS